MSTFTELNLVLHIVFGLLGVMAIYSALVVLMKDKPSVGFLRFMSVSGLVFVVLSWITGAYYYTTYYGSAVKPIIKAGKFPWAHGLMMEAKEHTFLLLPFLAAVLVLVVLLGNTSLLGDPRVRRPLAALAGVAFTLGAIIALSGVVVSGAVR